MGTGRSQGKIRHVFLATPGFCKREKGSRFPQKKKTLIRWETIGLEQGGPGNSFTPNRGKAMTGDGKRASLVTPKKCFQRKRKKFCALVGRTEKSGARLLFPPVQQNGKRKNGGEIGGKLWHPI